MLLPWAPCSTARVVPPLTTLSQWPSSHPMSARDRRKTYSASPASNRSALLWRNETCFYIQISRAENPTFRQRAKQEPTPPLPSSFTSSHHKIPDSAEPRARATPQLQMWAGESRRRGILNLRQEWVTTRPKLWSLTFHHTPDNKLISILAECLGEINRNGAHLQLHPKS